MVFQTTTAAASPAGESSNVEKVYRSCPKHGQSSISPNLLVLDLRSSSSSELENAGGIVARRRNDLNNNILSNNFTPHSSSIVGPIVNTKAIQPSREPFTQITKSTGSHPIQNIANGSSRDTKSSVHDLKPRHHSKHKKIVKDQQQHRPRDASSSHHPTTYPPPLRTTPSSSNKKGRKTKKKKKCHKRTTSHNLRAANEALSAFSSQSSSGFSSSCRQNQSSSLLSSPHQLSSLPSTPLTTNITSSLSPMTTTTTTTTTTMTASSATRVTLTDNSLTSSSSIVSQMHDTTINTTTNNNIDDDDRYKLLFLRSSEQDPSQHQITIPSSSDCLRHAKLCATMELYDTIMTTAAPSTKGNCGDDGTAGVVSATTTNDARFDFDELVGLSRRELEELGGRHYRYRDDAACRGGSSSSSRTSMMMGDNNDGLFIGTKEMNRSSSFTTTSNKLKMKKKSCSKNNHNTSIKIVVASLLDGTDDDLVVEGYYHHDVMECHSSHASKKKTNGRRGSSGKEHDNGRRSSSRVQVSIFGSQNRRQFIVCYRGSQEEQDKPLKKKYAKLKNLDDSPACHLHPQQPVRIHPLFRTSYYCQNNNNTNNEHHHSSSFSNSNNNNLETTIFAKLDELTTRHPFCDVIFCGHSYGAALATIGAARFAGCYPMISVEAHLFGSTKVGDVSFRHMAHSLPNLKIIRIEHGNDPYVLIPSSSEWYHVGHTISINSQPSSCATTTTTTTTTSSTTVPTSSSSSNSQHFQVQAFRFDERPLPPKKTCYYTPWKHLVRVSVTGNKKTKKDATTTTTTKTTTATKDQRRKDHDIKSYVHALEQLTVTAGTMEEGGKVSSSWVDGFVGQEGNGVNGLNNEARFVV